MTAIHFRLWLAGFTALWILIRVCVCLRQKSVSWKREGQMLLVYLCIVLVTRYTFFPFYRINGEIQPLLLDPAKILPLKIRLKPLVHLLEHPNAQMTWINFIGNSILFIPLGVVWPYVFKSLDSHRKVMAAGIGCSVLIELLQLFCYTRLTDIDDVILNTVSYSVGYGMFLLAKRIFRCRNDKQNKK